MDEILEGKKIIAEFMGLGKVSSNKSNELYAVIVNGKAKGYFHPNKMLYDTSWEWLMEVLIKIEHMGYNVNITGITCSVTRLLEKDPIVSMVLGCRDLKNKLVFLVIVKFLKWYNENK